ncbi:MAG: YHS domain-containing (seleno)protein [Elainellaceae cyanobacterium]
MISRKWISIAAASVVGIGAVAAGYGYVTHGSLNPLAIAQTVGGAGAKAEVYAQNGIAIKGADPVAYFTQGQYVSGSSAHEYVWQGTTWQFSSAENRDLFAANPEQYAPEYGGYCAWAVSQGYTAPIDPTAWSIVDGKLYLNFNSEVQARWERDIPGFISQANQNWPGVLAQ